MLKKYNINNAIKKNLKKRQLLSNFKITDFQRIGCIVDLDMISSVHFIEDFVKKYEIRAENCIILGYKNQATETHLGGTPIFTWKDIDFWGRIHNYHADRLGELEYDILLNYFNEPKPALLLATSSVKAKLKIGVQGIGIDYNDLIINCDYHQSEIFIKEVEKIIQTMR